MSIKHPCVNQIPWVNVFISTKIPFLFCDLTNHCLVISFFSVSRDKYSYRPCQAELVNYGPAT